MRADQTSTRIHYRGSSEDFILMLSGTTALQAYRKELKFNPGTNTTIPLTDILDSFTIFITSKQGNQGLLDTASKATLENEFGTKDEDKIIRVILEKGEVKEAKGREREGNTNLSIGTMGGH